MVYFHLLVDSLDSILKNNTFLAMLPRQFEPLPKLSIFVKIVLTDICFYIPAIIMTVFIPVRFGHYFVPFSKPLVFVSSVLFDYDAPLDTIFYYVLVPLVVEKIDHKKIILRSLENYFIGACDRFGLNVLLQDQYIRGKKLSLFAFSLIFFILYIFILCIFLKVLEPIHYSKD